MTRARSSDTTQRPAVATALRAAAARRGIALENASRLALEHYLDVLLVWRRRMSLVAQDDALEIIAKHVEDSFAVVPLVQADWRVADLGSGAGFPGLVVALVCPHAQVTLVESRQRRVSFLRAAVREAGATNVRVIGRRVEDLARLGELQACFDMAVSRAVWTPANLAALAGPLLRRGGTLVAMAGPSSEEMAGSRVDGYGEWEMHSYQLRRGERRLLLIAKKCST